MVSTNDEVLSETPVVDAQNAQLAGEIMSITLVLISTTL